MPLLHLERHGSGELRSRRAIFGRQVGRFSPPARGTYVVGARRAALEALAVAVAQAGAQPPRVTGEAAAASAFASTWAERRRTPVHPAEAQGIYTLDRLVPPTRTPTGFCRPATADAVPLV